MAIGKAQKILTKELLAQELKVNTQIAIANKYGFSLCTVYKYAKKFGLLDKFSKEQKFKEELNKKYDKLTILKLAPTIIAGGCQRTAVTCVCDCGTVRDYIFKYLKDGRTRSCGCVKEDRRKVFNYQEISGAWFNIQKKRGKNLQLGFDITIQDIWDVFIRQNRKCIISNLDISFYIKQTDLHKQTVSLDRIDSSKGYTKDNIQLVHKRVNSIKGNMSMDELKFWIYEMYHTLQPEKQNNIILTHVRTSYTKSNYCPYTEEINTINKEAI